MSHRQYAEDIASHTKHFLNKNPYTDDSTNIEQYLNVDHNIIILKQYQTLLSLTGGNSVLDIGMGIGFSKMINPCIDATNPLNIGLPGSGLHYQKYMEEQQGISSDFLNGDCRIHLPWIQTKNQYDFVILHRFLPWAGQTLDYKVFVNIFTDVLRVLKECGKVYYTPISIHGLHTNEWKKINTGMNTFEITRQQLHNAINNTNKVLRSEVLSFT